MNKKKIPGINGFEELFEVYQNKDEYLQNKKAEQDNGRNNEQYELQHFLEQENTRLSNLESFFTKKIPAKTNFSQTEKLIQVQKDRILELNNKLHNTISKPNSPIQQNLAQIFNAHFGQN